MGHIDWSVPSLITGKPDARHHQHLLDITSDHSLHQMTDIPTRNDRVLDIFFVKNPTNINKLTTLPPIGLADHDIVYIELDTQLKRVRETPRKIMRYDNANWENIRTDLNDTMRTIKDKYTSCKANELCNIYKVDLIKFIETNIPHKITYKNRLPWVTNNVRKHINK